MATPESPWAEAFEYRFPSGDLEGHALGNLIIAGLANVTGDFGRALDLAAGLLGAHGRVLPATVACRWCSRPTWPAPRWWARSTCPSPPGPITSVSIVPPDAPAPDEVLDAVSEADQVVIGPGSLFTSVLAVCVVPGIRAALAARTGGRIYVCNLRPQPPETAGFTTDDHLRAVRDHGVPVDVMVPPGDLARPDGPVTIRERLAAVLRLLT